MKQVLSFSVILKLYILKIVFSARGFVIEDV